METGPARPNHAVRKALIGLTACLLTLLLAAAGSLLYVEHRLNSNLHRVEGVFDGLTNRPERPTGSAADAMNVLVLGTDRRSARATTGSDARAAAWVPGLQRSDTMMIVHIDGDRRAATVVSIPRDSWVLIPGHGMNKINAAFSYGGPRLAVQTVENLTGVHIDHLAMVDWAGFKALIDTLGGVEVVVPETTTDTIRDVTWTAGEHHLDGAQALLYARQRYGLPNGDLDRVRRQQAIIRSLLQASLHQEMRKDPRMLYDFLDTVTSHVSVDADWSGRDLFTLAVSLRNLRSANITYLTAPVAGYGRRGDQSVVFLDRATDRRLWSAMITDELDGWLSRHAGDLTSSIVR